MLSNDIIIFFNVSSWEILILDTWTSRIIALFSNKRIVLQILTGFNDYGQLMSEESENNCSEFLRIIKLLERARLLYTGFQNLMLGNATLDNFVTTFL